MPGLYFKYDMSALKVIVKQDREHFLQFLVRISSVVAGIIVISGYLKSVIQLVVDMVKRKKLPASSHPCQPLKTTPIRPNDGGNASGSAGSTQNYLISNANQMADMPFNFTVKKL